MESLRVREQISISAPSRLHFGLFSIGDTVARKFGGIGLMIDSPRTKVTAWKADSFQIADRPGSAACRSAVENWYETMRVSLLSSHAIDQLEELPVRIVVDSLPPRHSGFGSGTQLALATVMAATRLLDLPVLAAGELSTATGRGKRSGIGSHGFCQGGFLVDRGKLSHEQLAPLDFRTEFPEPWRVVTVILNDAEGLSGDQEMDAFSQLPETSRLERDEMIDIVRNRIIPGVLQRDFESFSEAIYEFGRRSGMMFEKIQNGPYNSPQIETLIGRIRSFGVNAAGQSSWGPCVFAITRNDEGAHELTEFLQSEYGDRCSIQTTKADNQGALAIDHESTRTLD